MGRRRTAGTVVEANARARRLSLCVSLFSLFPRAEARARRRRARASRSILVGRSNESKRIDDARGVGAREAWVWDTERVTRHDAFKSERVRGLRRHGERAVGAQVSSRGGGHDAVRSSARFVGGGE